MASALSALARVSCNLMRFLVSGPAWAGEEAGVRSWYDLQEACHASVCRFFIRAVILLWSARASHMSRARLGGVSAHGGFGVGIGVMCVPGVIPLDQACFSVPGVMTGARLRPALSRSLSAILVHAFVMKVF